MAIDIASYTGREQAYVKHYFLDNYLERLVHKTAYRFDHIVYVDGFSGPWQSSGENHSDTSFGIALSALRKARASWLSHGRNVKMSAHLVERSGDAFRQLQLIPPKYPDVEVVPYNDDFVAAVPKILASIPSSAFVFVLIDPKGWRIPLEKIADLLKRPNTEIVFNFMFDFINRFASMTEANVVAGLDELMPRAGWREKLIRLKDDPISDASIGSRKAILVEAFSNSLSDLGGYDYVAETPVLRPLKDRTLYSLIYATRKPAGIEVFRDCQVKTLREQALIRSATKISARREITGQAEMFEGLAEMAPDETAKFLSDERDAAKSALLGIIPYGPTSVSYGEVWPQILAKRAIRKTELGAMVAELRKEAAITISEWPPRKRTPEDEYRLSRPDPK